MSAGRVLRPRPLSARRTGSLVDVRPSPAQRRAIDAPVGQALLVLGDAGHGKTTLALLRLAALAGAARGRFQARVVVPEEGLCHLVDDALLELGLPRHRVRAITYDRWALREARACFPDLPLRTGADASPAVVRLKRDPALADAIALVGARAPGRVDDAADAEVRPGHAGRGDLQHLFGDAALLEATVAAARPRLPAHAIGETLAHTRVQFSPRSERAFAHVTDRARLVAVDGAELDDGTPTADADSVDAEDAAVIFAIDRIRAEGAGVAPEAPRALDALVLDEAQELAPIELSLLSRALRPGGTLVVAGDAEQQLDPTTTFPGWDTVLDLLGAHGAERVVLEHGFRCPPPVVALARAVRHGAKIPLERYAGLALAPAPRAEIARFLDDEIAALRQADPTASLAVLFRDVRGMEALRAALATVVPRGRDGRFPSHGPILATVDQVRGLEFDHVVVPDASEYEDTPAERRRFYVAVTRTRHQLVTLGAPFVA